MKILKEGNVEQKKFACPGCGCEFVATLGDTEWWGEQVLNCPTCATELLWDDGQQYEKPSRDDRKKLAQLIEASRYFSSSTAKAAYLIANGVTFKE